MGGKKDYFSRNGGDIVCLEGVANPLGDSTPASSAPALSCADSVEERLADPTTLTVSVIVPVYNGGEVFARCLDTLRSARPAPEEIIVVADGAADDSAELAERLGLNVVRTAGRSGPAAARNLGARQARGEVLLFLDADVSVDPSIIARVDRAFCRYPEAAALLGSYDDAPGAANFLSQYKNLLHHHVHQQGREEAFTFWGACGAIRRDVFLAVGGFDERRYRRPCIEDIELGYRLKAAGHRIFLCKDLQVKHWKRWGVASLFRTDFFHRALPWTELILRSRRLDNDLNISRSARVKVMLVYLLAGALALSALRPWTLLPAAALAILLFVLDVHLWRFFWRKRGPLFALRTVPWHWFHYGYIGLAFAIGVARHACHLSRLRER